MRESVHVGPANLTSKSLIFPPCLSPAGASGGIVFARTASTTSTTTNAASADGDLHTGPSSAQAGQGAQQQGLCTVPYEDSSA